MYITKSLVIVLFTVCVCAKTTPINHVNTSKLIVYPPLVEDVPYKRESRDLSSVDGQTKVEANSFYKPDIVNGNRTTTNSAINQPTLEYSQVLHEMNSLKDNLQFLSETQRMLLESINAKQQHEYNVMPTTTPPPVMYDYNSARNTQREPEHEQSAVCADQAYNVGAPTKYETNQTPALSNNHYYTNPNNNVLPQQTQVPYQNDDRIHKYQNQYYNGPSNSAPPLPSLPYGNEEPAKTIIKQIPIPQPHQRLLPKSRQLPKSSANLLAEIRRMRLLRAERQARSQLVFRETSEREAQRSLEFLKQGLMQAFWTVLTVIGVQMAPLAIFIIKLLFKSFVPAISGFAPQRAFDGGNGFRLFGRGFDDDGFALNRFGRNMFGAKQFGEISPGVDADLFEDNEGIADEDFGDIEPLIDQDAVIEETETSRHRGGTQRRNHFRQLSGYYG